MQAWRNSCVLLETRRIWLPLFQWKIHMRLQMFLLWWPRRWNGQDQKCSQIKRLQRFGTARMLQQRQICHLQGSGVALLEVGVQIPPLLQQKQKDQASLDVVLASLPQLTSTVQQIADRQTVLESQLVQTSRVSRALSQPLSAQVPVAPTAVPAVAKLLQAPPKNALRTIPPAEPNAPQELMELEDVRNVSDKSDLAKAMLAQSAALTTLVAQLASSSQDPLSDLQNPGSAGTRGSAGRARLQAELALHRGLFFDSVLKSMSRRMSPTSSAEKPAAELLSEGICGTKYLERFGGYGRQKDLGVIQYQVMTAVDFMMAENWGAAKDTVALLAVMLEQACLDSGRMEVAQILTLQEDVPASVFTNRQLASTSRACAFAPLSDQRWVTTAIAFLKELDTISTKRTELLGSHREATGSGAVQPSPKSPSKKKGKGRGRGQSGQQAEEEDQ